MFIIWRVRRGFGMFRGTILGITYYTWGAYKRAWNEAVEEARLLDKKGRKITRLYEIN